LEISWNSYPISPGKAIKMFQIIQDTLSLLKKKNSIVPSDNKSAKHIKINFSDFWPGFNKGDNYFVELLRTQYSLEITDKPDFLIYSAFGSEHKKFNCTKIFYTGENLRPNFKECDYAFTFDFINNPKHYRLPLYAWWISPNDLIKPASFDAKKSFRKKQNSAILFMAIQMLQNELPSCRNFRNINRLTAEELCLTTLEE
jgi:hypothetical protein